MLTYLYFKYCPVILFLENRRVKLMRDIKNNDQRSRNKTNKKNRYDDQFYDPNF